MKRLFVSLIFFFLLISPLVSSAGIDISIEEGGKVTSFYGDYFIARINGSITIYNPSSTEFFDVSLPLYMSTYILTSPDNTDDTYIDEKGIHILELPANGSVVFNYLIGGISTEDFTENGNAMLETAITTYDFQIYSSIMGSLFKAPFEDPTLTGRNNTRLISVHLTNPTGFDFVVDLVKVVKTASLNPGISLADWDFSSQLSSLGTHQTLEFDFFDEAAYEGEIYWLQTDIYLDNVNLVVVNNLSFFDQDDLFIPETEGTNITYNETTAELFEKRVFVRKLVSSSVAIPGESTNVSIVVNNFGTTSLDATLSDEFPFGFELSKIYSADSVVDGSSLVWNIAIAPRTAKRFTYELDFVDEDSLGVDYFTPAIVEYGDNFVYSQSVPFVRQYVVEKKVYMQKSLDFLPNGDVEVEITVRNLGESSISNLIVKEFLNPRDEFKEITKPFRNKGVWHIDKLIPGEIWELSYVTDKTTILNTFPELFGVPRSSLFKNIILKNIVESKFKILETSIVEIFGLSLLALVIIAYILPHNVLVSLKRNFIKDLKMTDNEISSLKKSSSRKFNFHESSSSSPIITPTKRQQVNESVHHSTYLSQRKEKIEQTQAILDKIKNKMNEENND